MIEIIDNVVKIVESEGIGFIGKLGVFTEKIADGVNKYLSTDPRISHFIAFIDKDSLTDSSFSCKEKNLTLTKIESYYGQPHIGYNFRENYTQFTFPVKNKKFVESLYFIKDNKIEEISWHKFQESTPKGNNVIHNDISFDGFCLKLKGL